ncbi:MAG: hypothetical protein F6J98_28875 [Moorea sp. SIO4G2]|uniref:hypothetical protein n=1 Tax=unclassified Moorena TaxID=2683338 RepID=UPI0013FC95DA|nr:MULTISPECIES: hypothetical protein [unclassified Moorena]NEO64207.1 hypothetical protein [Moorena sp. SIO4G2]NEP99724.1 hypothetical protein [Moorena sp. SIO3F7]
MATLRERNNTMIAINRLLNSHSTPIYSKKNSRRNTIHGYFSKHYVMSLTFRINPDLILFHWAKVTVREQTGAFAWGKTPPEI